MWYGEGGERNRSFVPRDEDQTNNRGELRAAFYALSRQPAGKPLHMVVDLEWVEKGVTEWGAVWRRHKWRTATGDVSHRDLWEPFLDLVQTRGDLFPIQWVPSHVDIMGNEKADQLAEERRVRHWAYSREWVREVQRSQSSEWQALGLRELDSEVSNSVEASEGQSSEERHSCGCSTHCTPHQTR